MKPLIAHQERERRFVAHLPEDDAVLEYDLMPAGVMNIQSTYVPSGARRQGIGAALVEAAVGHARERGWRVTASCWYARDWLDAHPDLDGPRG